MLVLLSMLVLIAQPLGYLGTEMNTYMQRLMTNACTLVVCSPTENGLPGRDGRDGREGPRGEKGDPGKAGTSGLSRWEEVSLEMITNRQAWILAMEDLGMGFFPSWG